MFLVHQGICKALYRQHWKGLVLRGSFVCVWGGGGWVGGES